MNQPTTTQATQQLSRQSTRRKSIILNRECTEKTNHEKPSYGWCPCIATVWGIVAIVVDISTDVYLAYQHYMDSHYWWFALTLSFVLSASVIGTLLSLWWYVDDYKSAKKERCRVSNPSVINSDASTALQIYTPPSNGKAVLKPNDKDSTSRDGERLADNDADDYQYHSFSKCTWFARGAFLFCCMAPMIRYIESVYYGCKVMFASKSGTTDPLRVLRWFRHMVYEDRDSLFLRMVECFIEAAPQLILQLYILEVQGFSEGSYLVFWQGFGCVSSLSAMSWSLASYQQALRRSQPDVYQLTWLGVIMQFCWKSCTIACRVVAFAYFALVFKYWLFLVIAVHFILMLLWISYQRTDFSATVDRDRRPVLEFMYNVVVALMHIFVFFNISRRNTLLRYIVFYFLVYFENVGMVLFAYSKKDSVSSYDVPVILIVILLFFVGIFFQAIYYEYIHPDKRGKINRQDCGLCFICINALGDDLEGKLQGVEPTDSLHPSNNDEEQSPEVAGPSCLVKNDPEDVFIENCLNKTSVPNVSTGKNDDYYFETGV